MSQCPCLIILSPVGLEQKTRYRLYRFSDALYCYSRGPAKQPEPLYPCCQVYLTTRNRPLFWWTQQDLNPYTRIKGPVCFRCTIDPSGVGGQCWCRSNLYGASNRCFHRISLPPLNRDNGNAMSPPSRKRLCKECLFPYRASLIGSLHRN